MSSKASVSRHVTVPSIRSSKGQRKLIAATAYGRAITEVVDEWVDIVLIDDIATMGDFGQPTLLSFTLEHMVSHARAVSRSARRACVAAGLPFSSRHKSPAQALDSALRLLEAGASAVKVEGGVEMADTVAYLVKNGVPVIAQLRRISERAQGAVAEGGVVACDRMIQAARELERAGAFCLVLEGVGGDAAGRIAAAVSIPVLAGAGSDGQILDNEDILGLGGDFVQRMARQHADMLAVVEPTPIVQTSVPVLSIPVAPARARAFGRARSPAAN
ncbi:3-methyl-2-oxobutanoate hydroxymethyltransferase [Chromobacterium phragmitis]|uniref:3-methyl-2-oxobutanoate hydroxymethyltransferase n=1 Tax=Chromobacterium phragmitis TaxID=2202141 RepID=A0A344UFJ5_9NEIS|nr:3-methyl-2-oxobutanoate hydroxymethyltransferase [Chromobacterium phragmitis]AXE34043.1 3-methyl-2-oxobutanoate hydroxymethyltransferase [Chromobacterium phragmitis]